MSMESAEESSAAMDQPLIMESGESSAAQQPVSIEVDDEPNSSSRSGENGWKYDVFLSFSTWCLDELAKSIECMKLFGQGVHPPVFYGVTPSQVKHQTVDYSVVFSEYDERFKEEMDRVDRWRKALFDAASIAGWETSKIEDGHEAKRIKLIVEDILRKPNLRLTAQQKSYDAFGLFIVFIMQLEIVFFYRNWLFSGGYDFDNFDRDFDLAKRIGQVIGYVMALLFGSALLFSIYKFGG